MDPNLQPSTHQELEIGDFKFSLLSLPWDVRAFGHDVFELEVIECPLGIPELSRLEFAQLLELQLGLKPPTLVSARVEASQLGQRHTLESLGFAFREMTMRPVLEINAMQPCTGEFEVKAASHEDFKIISKIAAQVFNVGRFSSDLKIPKSRVESRFMNWVAQAEFDPAKILLPVYQSSSQKLAGFFLVRLGTPESDLELTAVTSEFQGKSYAGEIWKAALKELSIRQVTKVGTQFSAENVALFRVYSKLGFTYRQPKIAYHYWLTASGSPLRRG